MADQWKSSDTEDVRVPMENDEFRGRADEDDDFDANDDLDEEEDDEPATF
jgi:hypothetical protein